jgi:hypothetical protein
MRAVSNLTVPKNFQLTRHQKSTGFMFFYNKKFSETPLKLFNSIALQALFPVARTDAFMQDGDKKFKKETGLNHLISDIPRAALRRSTDPSREGFEFDCVLYRGYELGNSSLQKTAFKELLPPSALDNYFPVELTYGFHKTETFVHQLRLTAPTLAQIAHALVGLDVRDDNGTVVIVGRWFISRSEAEAFTATQFVAIRPANLYTMLNMWLATSCGTTQRLPQSSMPISHIASSVKKASELGSVEPRNMVDGVVAMEDGTLRFIPQVDNSVLYEQALQDYGQMEDGSYSFAPSRAPSEIKIGVGGDDSEGSQVGDRKLPVNMPVFTDWVNLKFAYSNTSGTLAVLDLERCVPVRPYHVRTLLEKSLDDAKFVNDTVFSTIAIAQRMLPSIKLEPLPEELVWGKLRQEDASGTTSEYFVRAVKQVMQHNLMQGEVITYADVKLHHIAPESPIVSLRPLGRMFYACKDAIEQNLDNAYKHYSVQTVTTILALSKLVVRYGSQYDKVVEVDNKDRDVYTSQGEDPNHETESVPLLQKNFAYLPHQNKAANLQRRSPKLTVLNVDAGGGKTALVLTRMLKDIRAGKCKRPLVLCPGHLVSGYVKEAVYVTEGRLNVVPITTYTWRQNGFKRLAKLIESAPPNTVFISDYDFLKRNAEVISYGVRPITIYRNIEFMRQFGFDEVFCDESHYLKNQSTRSEAVMRLLSEIPNKLLASGTFVADTPTDIVAQFALLDPTVFGSRENFMNKYALETRGNKVIAWRPNAARDIVRTMKQHCVFVTCQRKEWAALLPEPDETFHAVDMTENQMTVYRSVLESTMALIREAMEKNPALKKALEDATDENKFDQLASMLKPYLSRLESYLAAPARDQLGNELLTTPEDRVSPKSRKLYEICRNHLQQNIPGKILIFTNHIAVAEDIYENFPEDLKPLVLYYTAGQKMEAFAEFENNDRKQIMVGVEKSMNTGLNFQFVSRLCRVETVWTPGEAEQGDSRVNRPQLKKEERRTKLYFDWIMTNRSFDVTKVSRLIGKTIQKSKFDNAEDPAYQSLPDVDLIPMTLDTIIGMNDFATTLAPYLDAYQGYKQVVHADYAQYREANKDNMAMIPVPPGGLLPGSKLMARTPYVPDMSVYGTDSLGLIRYDEFMRQDIEYDEDNDDGDGDEGETEDTADSVSQRDLNRQEAEKVIGLGVHTEFGDGTIIGVSRFRLKVQLANGSTVRPRKLASFVITRAETNSKDIRKQLLKLSGDIPVDSPVDVPPTSLKLGKGKTIKNEAPTEPVESDGIQVELYFTMVNDYLGIGLYTDDNPDAVSAMSTLGFRPVLEHYYTPIKNAQTLLALFRKWKESGLTLPKKANEAFKSLYEMLRSKGSVKSAGWASKLDLRNFFMREYRPSNDESLIKPYPLIKDDDFYVALPSKGQMGTRAAIRLVVPNVKWTKSEGNELVRFVADKAEASKVMQAILAAGVKVTNLQEMKQDFKNLRVVRRKAAKADEE